MVEETSDSDRYCRFGYAKAEHEVYTFKMAKACTNSTQFHSHHEIKNQTSVNSYQKYKNGV